LADVLSKYGTVPSTQVWAHWQLSKKRAAKFVESAITQPCIVRKFDKLMQYGKEPRKAEKYWRDGQPQVAMQR